MNSTPLINSIFVSISVILYSITIYYVWNVFYKNIGVIKSEKFSRKKKFRMMFNLLVRTGNIRMMNPILILLAFFSFYDFGLLAKIVYKDFPEYCLAISVAILLFIIGLSGYIQYRREEMPWRLGIEKGWVAKTSSMILLIFCWGFSIIALIYGLIIWLN